MNSSASHKAVQASIAAQAAGMIYDDSTDLESKEWCEAFTDALKEQYSSSAGNTQISIERDHATLRWTPNQVDQQAESHHKKALQFARRRDFLSAIAEWEQAGRKNPNDPHYFFNLAIALFENNQHTDATKASDKALKICPIYYRAYFLRGRAFVKLRKFPEARNSFREGLKFDAQNIAALLNLAASLSILREYDSAIDNFQQLLALKPGEARAHFGLAKVYSARGDIEKANEHYGRVVELDKTGVLAASAQRLIVAKPSAATAPSSSLTGDELFSTAYRAYVEGDYARAAELYENHLKKKRKDARAWSALASAYLRTGDSHKAAEACESATKHEPSEGAHFKKLAIIYDFLGEPDRVVEAVRKARRLGKADSTTLGILGKNLVHLGNFAEAIQALEQSLRENKNNLMSHYFIAAAYSENEMQDRALEHLQHIVAIRTSSPLKAKAERLMQELQKQGEQ